MRQNTGDNKAGIPLEARGVAINIARLPELLGHGE
jgi:hypothetical protein